MSNCTGVEVPIAPATTAVDVAVPPISPPLAFPGRLATRVFQVTSGSRKNDVRPYGPIRGGGNPFVVLAVACMISNACLMATLGSNERIKLDDGALV